MQNNTTMATLKVEQKSEKQEALGRSKYHKISNWAKTKLWPVIEKAASNICHGAKALGRSLSSIHISWVAILALVILANMAKNGEVDNMPNLKWLLESAMRLIEWGIGLLRNLLKLAVDFMDLPGFGIFDWFKNWVMNVFAM